MLNVPFDVNFEKQLIKKKRKNVGKISWNMHPGETLNRTLYTENFGRI